MDSQWVKTALDSVIAEEGDAGFQHLSQGLPPKQVALNVVGALKQLNAMARGAVPEYNNEWVTLFYNLWYQPKQINVAYRVINAMIENRGDQNNALSTSGALYVADFGCGSLAMQFGVALAAADAISRGQQLTSIHIDAIDPNKPMTALGESTWNRFVKLVSESVSQNQNHWVSCLSSACGMMEYGLPGHPDVDTITERIRSNPNEERWLSALHTVYQTNVGAVKSSLSDLCKTIQPHAGFITTFKQKAHLARIVSPFDEKFYVLHPLREIGGGLNNDGCQKITEVRHSIYKEIESSGSLQEIDAADSSRTRFFLGNLVKWEPKDPRYSIYIKR